MIVSTQQQAEVYFFLRKEVFVLENKIQSNPNLLDWQVFLQKSISHKPLMLNMLLNT